MSRSEESRGLPRTGDEPHATLDLKGVSCPLNYAKAKLALEKMGAGEVLEIELDRGNPAEYVPRTLQSDGHEILEEVISERACRLVVRKKPYDTEKH